MSRLFVVVTSISTACMHSENTEFFPAQITYLEACSSQLLLMGKKSGKKQREASLSNAGLTLAVLSFFAISGACFLPYWVQFSPVPMVAWNIRYMGLLKLGGQYSNPLTLPADLTWMQVRDQVCAASFAQNGMVGMTGASAGTALMTAAAGMICPVPCKQNLFTRCKMYRYISYANFLIMGLLVGGAFVTITGAVFPLLGKE